MKNIYILGIVALAIIAVLGIGMVSAFGFGRGIFNGDLTDAEKTAMQEKKQAMQTAIQNKDFAAWKSLMEERIAQMQAQITQENFNKLVEVQNQMLQAKDLRAQIKQAKESGNTDKVKELQAELAKLMPGKRFGKGHFGMNKNLGK